MPGRRSTPELTSTTSGRTRATATATRRRGEPAGEHHRAPGQPLAGLTCDGQVERDAGSPRRVRHPRLDQHGVGVARRCGQARRDRSGSAMRSTRHTSEPLGAEPGGTLRRRVRAAVRPPTAPSSADREDVVDRTGRRRRRRPGPPAPRRSLRRPRPRSLACGPPAKTTPRYAAPAAAAAAASSGRVRPQIFTRTGRTLSGTAADLR